MNVIETLKFEEIKNRTLLTMDQVGYRNNIRYFYDAVNDRLASCSNPKELERLKGRYFLISSANTALDRTNLFGEPRWDDKLQCVAIKIGRIQCGKLIYEGEVRYHLKKGVSVNLAKSQAKALKCHLAEERYRSNKYYLYLQDTNNDLNIETDDFYDLSGQKYDLDDIFRRYYKFTNTGVILHTGYNNLYFSREKVPTALADAPAIDRYSVPMKKIGTSESWRGSHEGAQAYQVEANFEDSIEVEPLDSPECQAAILTELDTILEKQEANTSSRRYYYSGYDGDYMRYAFTLALGPNPQKGTRRPIGHIYCKIVYGPYNEVFCLGYCKLSETGEIHDMYLRNKDDGKYYRICNRFLSSLKDLTARMTVLRSTLDIAKNLRNKNLISTILADEGTCNLSDIRRGAMIRHSALFIEQLLKLGYTEIANSMINQIGERSAWNETNCLGDLIPGAKEEATNIYDALGLKKPWAKWALTKATEHRSTYRDVGEFVDNARIVIACGFDENAPSKDAMLVAETIHQFKENHQFKSYYGKEFNAEASLVETRFNRLYADPKARIEIMKTYNRMVNKIKHAMPMSPQASLRYYSELFDDYCAIKSTGRSPEESHVFIEFGLSGDNGVVYTEDEIETMMRRVSDNASNIYKTYESEINIQLQQATEDLWQETRKDYRGYKKEIEDYVFLVPSTIYGEDPYSIKNEGDKQENCVYRSYAKRVAEGDYQIVLMRKKQDPETACVTIGINSSGAVDQTYTYRDAHITQEHGRIINLWIQSLNNTKKKIHMNGYPAGWCY